MGEEVQNKGLGITALHDEDLGEINLCNNFSSIPSKGLLKTANAFSRLPLQKILDGNFQMTIIEQLRILILSNKDVRVLKITE